MSESESYFAKSAGEQSSAAGQWVTWSDLEPIEMIPGLRFQPVLGEGVMVNFVHFEAHTDVPLHWHDEEQVAFVIDGEMEFDVAGETRTLRRGDAVVIPPNVPHAARTYDTPCLEVDVFHPPRRALLGALARD